MKEIISKKRLMFANRQRPQQSVTAIAKRSAEGHVVESPGGSINMLRSQTVLTGPDVWCNDRGVDLSLGTA